MRHTTKLLVLALCAAMAAACSPNSLAGDSRESVELDKYKLVLGPKTIKGIDDDASGLAYNSSTKTLLVAVNKPTVLVELDLKGNFKRKIRLKGFNDTEGVCWIDKDKYAVLEERRRNLVIVEIGSRTKAVDYTRTSRFLIEPTSAGNLGIEGVAYDPKGKRFFIVKEKSPRKIYEVKLPTAGGKAVITHPWDIEKKMFGMTDLAGIYYDVKTGHLLILSDESKCVVECTADGKKMISRLSLKTGSAGMTSTPGQPEGITMDDAGNLYICSEPNVLYVFSKSTRTSKQNLPKRATSQRIL